MYAAFNSDDGKLKGVSKEEALVYEEGLKNPLSRMRFPYSVSTADNQPYSHHLQGDFKGGKPKWAADHEESNAILAFANLAPLIAECDKKYPDYRRDARWANTELGRLLTAYGEAVALIPKP